MGACHCKGSVDNTTRALIKANLNPDRLASLLLDDFGFVGKNKATRLIDLSRQSERDQVLAARWEQLLADPENIRPSRDLEWSLTSIPCWLRSRVWTIASGALALKQQSSMSFDEYADSADQLTRSQVETDAPRTFSNHAYFMTSGQGRVRLIKLLHAIASRLGPEIGYVQGMNMVAAVILFVVDDDEDAFWILVAFIESLNMKLMYADGLRDLTENLNRLGQTISSRMPKLTAHFGEENLEPFCYGTPWFLTMFAYNLPIRQSARLYDVAFLSGMGPELIHRFALTLVKSFESELLKLSFTESTDLLKNIAVDDDRLESLIRESLGADLEGIFRIQSENVEEGGEVISIGSKPNQIDEKSRAKSLGQDWDIPGAVRSATAEAVKTASAGDNE